MREFYKNAFTFIFAFSMVSVVLGSFAMADTTLNTVVYPIVNGTQTIGATNTVSHIINLSIPHVTAVRSHIVFLQSDGVSNTVTIRLNNSICGSPTTVITGATISTDCTHRSTPTIVSGVVNISFTNDNLISAKTISAWTEITYETPFPNVTANVTVGNVNINQTQIDEIDENVFNQLEGQEARKGMFWLAVIILVAGVLLMIFGYRRSRGSGDE